MASIAHVMSRTADASGQVQASLPVQACGRTVQLVDESTCTLTPVYP